MPKTPSIHSKAAHAQRSAAHPAGPVATSSPPSNETARVRARVVDQSYELVEVAALKPHPRNPNSGDLEAIGESVEANGFYGACIAQRSTGHILVGNHRHRAARQAGLANVPCIYVDCDDEAALRILLADNRAGAQGRRSNAAVAEILRMLPDASRGTGYKPPEVTRLLQLHRPATPSLAPRIDLGRVSPRFEERDDDGDDHPAPSERIPSPARTRHALSIVLDAEEKRAWDAAKAKIGEKNDTRALMRLLESRRESVDGASQPKS